MANAIIILLYRRSLRVVAGAFYLNVIIHTFVRTPKYNDLSTYLYFDQCPPMMYHVYFFNFKQTANSVDDYIVYLLLIFKV